MKNSLIAFFALATLALSLLAYSQHRQIANIGNLTIYSLKFQVQDSESGETIGSFGSRYLPDENHRTLNPKHIRIKEGFLEILGAGEFPASILFYSSGYKEKEVRIGASQATDALIVELEREQKTE